MSLPFIAFFHDYGLINLCPTDNCRSLHSNHPRCRDTIIKVISCLPILGQIVGVIAICFGVSGIKGASNFQHKMVAVSLLLRGIVTFLGLGIICLLLDIIVTLVTFIKRH